MDTHKIDIPSRYEQLLTNLRQGDYRMTVQRRALVRLIASSEEHPNAAQLHAIIKHQFPKMSLATVYKTLNLLKELGLVLEIDLRDDSHYDGNRPHPHPHLICITCNKIIDGEAGFDTSAIRKLEEASGYKILRSQISFYGLCPDCKKASD